MLRFFFFFFLVGGGVCVNSKLTIYFDDLMVIIGEMRFNIGCL